MKKKRFFRQSVIEFLEYSTMTDKKILIIGGNVGEDVNRLKPSYSVELFDPNINALDMPIKSTNPNITYVKRSILDFESDVVFDYIIFYESLNYEGDLYKIFTKLKKLANRDTKIFVLEVNPLLLFVLKILRTIGLVTPPLSRNMLALGDLENLVNVFGFDTLDIGYRFLIPFKLLGVRDIVNSIIARTPYLRHFCFGQYIVFRLHPLEDSHQRLSCSVVIPCYNEEGNIRECISRIPNFGLWREIVVVNDGSKDRTEAIVREMMNGRSDIRLITYEKNGGKGYAVNMGWQESKGDVLMMLDCDSTTPPEEMVLFHDAMEKGAEFINGTRLIYPREKHSIPFFNRLGVSFFAHLISWITQKRITDTFCGTKVFLRKHWNCFQIKEFLWADWDLFFTAAKYRMKMVEIPVHYKTRKFGETKMRPLKHGTILLLRSIEGLKVIK